MAWSDACPIINKQTNMKLFLASLAFSALATANANAELITFDYTAKVNAAVHKPKDGGKYELVQSISFNGTTIDLGNTIRGSFTIDLDTRFFYHEGQGTTYSDYGIPKNTVSPNVLTMTVDQSGYGFSPKPGRPYFVVRIEDGSNAHHDSFEFVNAFDDENSGRYESVAVSLWQNDGSLIAGAPSSLDLSRASSAHLTYNFAPGGSNERFLVAANLTSLSLRTASPVPEPSTYAMMALGLLTLGAVRRRKLRGRGAPRVA